MPSSPHLPLPRRSYWILGWLLVAAIPVIYIATTVVGYSRNIVFWDEFDTALDLIIRINAGADWQELMHRLFAVHNEHRTVTSRLMFAASYWLTGTVNFHVIGAIGNLFLVGACVILILSVTGWERRIRLGVVLAFLMFQLEHFESLLWSGASIDHFQVVMLGVAAIAALNRQSLRSVLVAMLLGMVAVFTLAHGSLVWPVGAGLLWHQRRWKPLAIWCAGAVVVLALFLHGFKFNPGHQIAAVASKNVVHIVAYWLALLGGPLTLGDAGFAPWPGLLLLIGVGIAIARGATTREPVATCSGLFAIGALAMVAYGRVELAGTEINSRYLVLGALAWALLLFILLELTATKEKPFRWLLCALPAMAVFNLCANLKFGQLADGYVETRDRAATRFMQYGEDGRGIWRLHPQPGHADALLKMASERGLYDLPRVSHEAQFPHAKPSTRIITYIDELIVNDRAITAGGWAMIRGKLSKRGQVYLVLRSAKTTLIYSTVTLLRPDVAKAYTEPKWRLSGFRAVVERSRLPAEDFEVGVLIADGDDAEFMMTKNQLLLAAGKQAKAVHFTVGQ